MNNHTLSKIVLLVTGGYFLFRFFIRGWQFDENDWILLILFCLNADWLFEKIGQRRRVK